MAKAKRKSGSYKCLKCDRTFSMAGHLGRHMATIHGGASSKASARKRPGRSARSPSLGQPAGLLGSVQAWRADIAAQQAQIATQLAALDQLIATLGGTAGGHPIRSSPPAANGRAGSLRSFITQVLQAAGKPMRVAEIADAVLEAGFRTRNKTLSKSVGIVLAELPNVKKVERGVFAAT